MFLNNKATFILVVITCLSMHALAANEGFTYNSSVHIGFAPSTKFVAGSVGTVVITITGTNEDNGDGRVTLKCIKAPDNATPSDIIAYLPTGGDIPIEMPSIPGEYTYIAYISAHQNSDPTNHNAHEELSSNQVTVMIVTGSISVRAKKSHDFDDYAHSASVCAGGINSNAHIAEIQIVTDPPTSGVSGVPTIIGGNGFKIPSQLYVDGQTDSNGIIYGELISSDAIEDVSLNIADSNAIVHFDDNVQWNWQSNQQYITQQSTESITFIHHGEYVVGHTIYFNIDEIEVTNNNELQSSIDFEYISPLVYFFPTHNDTNNNGTTTTTLFTTDTNNVVEEYLSAIDNSIHVIDSSIGDELPLPCYPYHIEPVPGQIQVRSDPPINILSMPASLTQSFCGSSPGNGSYVFSNENLQFQFSFEDFDERKKVNVINWTQFNSNCLTGSYLVKIELDGAVFTDINKSSREYVQSNQTLNGQHFPIQIDNLPYGSNITIKITISDYTFIPTSWNLYGNATDCEDSQVVTEWHWIVKNPTSNTLPTNVSFIKQQPGNISAPAPDYPGINVWHQFGPDTNGPGDLNPNYKGITVLETYNTQPTSNILPCHILAKLIAAHPNWGNIQWTNYFVSSIPHRISTFEIGNDDVINDQHRGRFPLLAYLSPLGLKSNLFIDYFQHYEVPPNTVIGNYTIRRRFDGSGANAIYSIKKF